jgi:predicted metal-binding transcription factor (methanogenesis marker protein 9)
VHKPIDKPVDSNVDNSEDEDVKLAKQIAKYYITHSEKQTYEQFMINLNKQSDVRQIFKLVYGETRNHYFADHPTAP